MVEALETRDALFEREKKRFGDAVNLAITVSKHAAGRMPKKPIVMASYVFTRMCVAADTLLHLLGRDIAALKDVTLDHYSMGIIARNIVEAALMFHYLSEDGVSDEEWQLRGAILDLHDVVMKVRLSKSIGAVDSYKKFKETMTKSREMLKANEVFKVIDPERQQKLLAGHKLYLNGIRSTLKLVGFDYGYFDGVYAYLPSQVHVAPTSFYATDKPLSFGEPASYQYYFAAHSVAHARVFLLRAAIRLADSDLTVRQKIYDATYQSMQKLADIPFGD